MPSSSISVKKMLKSTETGLVIARNVLFLSKTPTMS